MGMLKLAKKWSKLKLTQKRCNAGGPWLRWASDAAEQRGEPGIQALEQNCPMVLATFEELWSLDAPPIKPLMAEAFSTHVSGVHMCAYCVFSYTYVHSTPMQVEKFYTNMMEMDISSSDLYVDSWGLRKLYGYAHRRQHDACKRNQVPNESSLSLMCGVTARVLQCCIGRHLGACIG